MQQHDNNGPDYSGLDSQLLADMVYPFGLDSVYTQSEGDNMATIRVIFRKHFNQSGEGDDYPTDFFNPSVELADMTFIEMRPPISGEYGQEEWEYETSNPAAIETDLNRCETCIRYWHVE